MSLPASTRPLYAQIKEAITKRIQEEEWPSDFRVPREEELAEEFAASRLTVRRALRELQTEGLLVRIQGRGTFVVGPRMQCAVFELTDISEEIEAGGGVHSSEVRALGVLEADDPLAKLLQLPAGVAVFHSRILHKEDGTPIQIEDRFVNSEEAPRYLEQDFSRITPHDYLLRETEVTTVDNSIRAVRPDVEACRLLRIDEGQPCLLLDRRTWTGSEVVTVNKLSYVGAHYSFRTRAQANRNATRYT